jgi:hypothetical protein
VKGPRLGRMYAGRGFTLEIYTFLARILPINFLTIALESTRT